MHLSYLFFMLKKCSFKFLPPRNWNQRILHVVTLEQGLERDFFQNLLQLGCLQSTLKCT